MSSRGSRSQAHPPCHTPKWGWINLVCDPGGSHDTRKPEFQPCAITDAASVLLDRDHGVIRAAYDEDNAFWGKGHDAEAELAFFQAWARCVRARVVQTLAPPPSAVLPPKTQLAPF